MASLRRQERLQSLMVEVLSELLQRQIKDPRLGFATVTRVELSSDLRHARVYVSVLGSDEEIRGTARVLERATGFLRSELAQRIRVRFVPEIQIRIDRGIEQGERVLQLLRYIEIPPETARSDGAEQTEGALDVGAGGRAAPAAQGAVPSRRTRP